MARRVRQSDPIPPRMIYESFRLNSFNEGSEPWPHLFIAPRDLANAGWYYLGERDRVRCGFCGGIYSEWLQFEEPREVHRFFFGRKCPFIQGISNNVPIKENIPNKLDGCDSSEPIDRECVVCLGNTKKVIFIPCNHISCCLACARRVDTCPICRKSPERKMKIYFS